MNAAEQKLVNEILKAHEAGEAAAQAELPWSQQKRSITYTNEEWNRLRCYILMTTQYRKGEREAWVKLADELDESGAPVFPNAAKNANYWAEMESFLDRVSEKIDVL